MNNTDDVHVGVDSSRKALLVRCGLIILAGILFFSMTTPHAVPAVLLIGSFVMLALMLWALVRVVLLLTGLDRRLPAVYSRGILVAGTLLPTLLLLLQSTGQLTVRDSLALGGLFALGLFYVGRLRLRTFQR